MLLLNRRNVVPDVTGEDLELKMQLVFIDIETNIRCILNRT